MSDSKRPETGPMRFGDDWPGIFIRGDQAFGIAMVLEQLVGSAVIGSDNLLLKDTVETLRSCVMVDGREPEGTQHAILREEGES